MTSLPPLTWLRLSTEDLGRWAWQRQVRWPEPLSSASIGRYDVPFDEMVGNVQFVAPRHTRGEERLLDSLAAVLAAPDHCAYVVRVDGDVETYYLALVRDEDAIVLVDEPGEIRLARVAPNLIAATVAAQLPKLVPAPTVRVTLPASTAALLAAGFARKAPEKTLRSALASAGVPGVVADRLLAGESAVNANGSVGALRYTGRKAHLSARCATWSETAEGGMISYHGQAGEVVWEPLTTQVVSRAISDALGNLREVAST